MLSKATSSETGRSWLLGIIGLIGAAAMAIALRLDWLTGSNRMAFDASHMMLACGGFSLLLSSMLPACPFRTRQIGDWVLIGIALLAVALASDLLTNLNYGTQWISRPPAINGKKLTEKGQPRTENVKQKESMRGSPAAMPHTRVITAKKPTERQLRAERVKQMESTRGSPGAKLIMIVFVVTAIALTRVCRVSDVKEVDIKWRQKFTAAGKFLSIAVQLGFLVLLIRRFNLVNPVFYHQIIFLIFYGFLIHYFLPLRYRLPFFFFLSVSGIVYIFGAVQAVWLIGIGLTLIGLCHVPVLFSLRVILLLLAGLALAEFRGGWIQTPWADAIWPILSSMFMFRLIAYMYCLKHNKAPVGFWPSVAYFFLLPNAVFPLFPVVDYATFRRTYYDVDRHLIYQTGVKWILRGILHLILYRYIYYYAVILPEEVNSVTNLVRYMVSNFLLILRLSGQFHLIVGLLHLFGFNLPQTMDRYLLASSFTDFWRRVNIYWKDFMQRVVFYPVYFRLRNRAPTAGLACAILMVFLITWALHSYQWFWLRGSFSVSLPDVLFWVLFGLLVVVNTLWEARWGRKREIAKQARTTKEIASLTLRVAGTFSIICILWSLWISTSVSEWFSLWHVPPPTWKDVRILTSAVIGGIVLVIWAERFRAKNSSATTGLAAPIPQRSFFSLAASTVGLIILLYLVSHPIMYSQLGWGLADVVHDLRTDRLNKQDLTLLHRGYYENLTHVNRFNSQLWELYNKRPNDWPHLDEIGARRTGNFLVYELRPWVATVFKGASFHTNRWGMRDKDYELKPPAGTFRIALLGASPEMGAGVADDETFDTLLEDRLNRENDRETPTHYEVLNFSVGGYTPLQRLRALETKVLPFEPDEVFYVGHATDRAKAVERLADSVVHQAPIPYDHLRQVIHDAGVEGKTSMMVVNRALQRYGNDIMSWTYRDVVELCRQHSIIPVYIFLPIFEDLGAHEIPDHLRLARESGFQVLNLSDLYKNRDEKSLRLAEWDLHPNAVAHQLIADRLYEELKKNRSLLQKSK